MLQKDKKDASVSGNDDKGDEVKFTLEQEIRLIQELRQRMPKARQTKRPAEVQPPWKRQPSKPPI